MACEEFRASFKKNTEEMTGVFTTAKEGLESAFAGSMQAMEQARKDVGEKVMTVGNSIEGLNEVVTRESEKIKKDQDLLRYEPLVKAGRGEIVSKRAAIASLESAILAVRPMLTDPSLEGVRDRLDVVVDRMNHALKYGMIS